MSPFLRSLSGVAVRAVMLIAGASGVDLPTENAETVVNALLIVGALAWSAFQKWQAHTRMQTAEMLVTLAERGQKF